MKLIFTAHRVTLLLMNFLHRSNIEAKIHHKYFFWANSGIYDLEAVLVISIATGASIETTKSKTGKW